MNEWCPYIVDENLIPQRIVLDEKKSSKSNLGCKTFAASYLTLLCTKIFKRLTFGLDRISSFYQSEKLPNQPFFVEYDNRTVGLRNFMVCMGMFLGISSTYFHLHISNFNNIRLKKITIVIPLQLTNIKAQTSGRL